MNDVKFEFPEGIQRMLQILNDNGFEAYVVGGAIRDTLMGKKPKDYDITTNALPSTVISLFDRLDSHLKISKSSSYLKMIRKAAEIYLTPDKQRHLNL